MFKKCRMRKVMPKVISLFVAGLFLFNQIAFAMPDISTLRPASLQKAGAVFGIGSELKSNGAGTPNKKIGLIPKSSSAGNVYKIAENSLAIFLKTAPSSEKFLIERIVDMLRFNDKGLQWVGLALSAWLSKDESLQKHVFAEAEKLLEDVEGAQSEYGEHLGLILELLPKTVDKKTAFEHIKSLFAREHYYGHKDAMAATLIILADELGIDEAEAFEYLASELRQTGKDRWRRSEATPYLAKLGRKSYVKALNRTYPASAKELYSWLENYSRVEYIKYGNYDDESKRFDDAGVVFRIGAMYGFTELALEGEFDVHKLVLILLQKAKQTEYAADRKTALECLAALIIAGKVRDADISNIASPMIQMLKSGDYKDGLMHEEISAVLGALSNRLNAGLRTKAIETLQHVAIKDRQLNVEASKALVKFGDASGKDFLRSGLNHQLQFSYPVESARALFELEGADVIDDMFRALDLWSPSVSYPRERGTLKTVVASAIFTEVNRNREKRNVDSAKSSSAGGARLLSPMLGSNPLAGFGSSSVQVQSYSELAGSFDDNLGLVIRIDAEGGPEVLPHNPHNPDAVVLAELFNTSFTLLPEILDLDPELKVYYDSMLGARYNKSPPSKKPQNIIRFSASLKRDSARYFNKNANRIEFIFNKEFVSFLSGELAKTPSPNRRDAICCILAQRLFHELGHSSSNISQYGQTREEYEIVVRDLRLYQLVKNSGLDDEIKNYYRITFDENPSFPSRIFRSLAKTNSGLQDSKSKFYKAVKVAFIEMNAIEAVEGKSVNAFVKDFKKHHRTRYEHLSETEILAFKNILALLKRELVDYEGGYLRTIIKLDQLVQEKPDILTRFEKVIDGLERLEQEAIEDYRQYTASPHTSYQFAFSSRLRERVEKRAVFVNESIRPYLEKIQMPHARPYTFLVDYLSQLKIRAKILAAENLFYLSGNQQVTIIPWKHIDLVDKRKKDGTIRQYLNFALNWSQALGFGMTRAENKTGGRQRPHTHPYVERTLSLSDDTWVVNYATIMDEVLERLIVEGKFSELGDEDSSLYKAAVVALSADIIEHLKRRRNIDRFIKEITSESPSKDDAKNFARLADTYKKLSAQEQDSFKEVLKYIGQNISLNLEEIEERHGFKLPFGHISYIPPEVSHYIKNVNPDIPSADCTMKDLFLQLYRMVGKPGVLAEIESLPPQFESKYPWGRVFTQVLTDMTPKVASDPAGQLYFAYDERGRYNPISTEKVSLKETLITIKPGRATHTFNLREEFGQPTSDDIHIIALQPWPRKIPKSWDFFADPKDFKAEISLYSSGSANPVETIVLTGGEQLVINNKEFKEKITHVSIKNISKPINLNPEYSTIVVLIPGIEENNPLKCFGPVTAELGNVTRKELEGSFVDSLELQLDLSQEGVERFTPVGKGSIELAQFVHSSLAALEELVKDDPELNKYLTKLLSKNDNRAPPEGIRIRVSNKLPVNAARYYNEATNEIEIILNETFIKTLLGAYDTHGAVKYILAERLFHELGHDNKISDLYGYMSQEYELIKKDAALHNLVREKGIQQQIDAYITAEKPEFPSGYYFKLLNILLDAPSIIADFDKAVAEVHSLEEDAKQVRDNSLRFSIEESTRIPRNERIQRAFDIEDPHGANNAIDKLVSNEDLTGTFLGMYANMLRQRAIVCGRESFLFLADTESGIVRIPFEELKQPRVAKRDDNGQPIESTRWARQYYAFHKGGRFSDGIGITEAENGRGYQQNWHEHVTTEQTVSLCDHTQVIWAHARGKDEDMAGKETVQAKIKGKDTILVIDGTKTVKFGEMIRMPKGFYHTLKNPNEEIPSRDFTVKEPLTQIFKEYAPPYVPPLQNLEIVGHEHEKWERVYHGHNWGEEYVHNYGPYASRLLLEDNGDMKYTLNEEGKPVPVMDTLIHLQLRLFIVKQGKTTSKIKYTPLNPDMPLYGNSQIIRIFPWPKKIVDEGWVLDRDRLDIKAAVRVFNKADELMRELGNVNGGDMIMLDNQDIGHFTVENNSTGENDELTFFILEPLEVEETPPVEKTLPASAELMNIMVTKSSPTDLLDIDNIASLSTEALDAAIATAKGDLANIFVKSRFVGELFKIKKAGTIVIDDESIPTNQRDVISNIYDENSETLKELERVTGCTIRLTSQLNDKDIRGELIIISDKKLPGYERAKYLNIKNNIPKAAESYLPLVPLIGIAKVLLTSDDVEYIQNTLNRDDFYRDIFGHPVTEQEIQNFLDAGIFELPVPKFDYEKVEQLQRQALAALVAA